MAECMGSDTSVRVDLHAIGAVRLPLGYCSEIAGMHKEGFMRFLGTFGVSVFRFDDLSELEEDLANA